MARELEMSKLVNLDVLKREMARADLDTLVASSPESTFYLSGVVDNTYVFLRDRLIIVIVYDGQPRIAIVSGIMEPLARATGWINDIRTYKEHAESPVNTLAEVLEEKRLTKGRIGIEAKWWTLAFYQELTQRLPHVKFLPADNVIQRVRAVKTSEEIERLRKSAQLTDEAVYEAWKQSHPGETERDVANRMADAWIKRGAERANHVMFAAGRNTTITHHIPGSKKLEPGDIVHSDHGAIFDSFWSDMGRLGVVSRASQRQTDLYKILWDIHQGTIARAKPGVEVRELFEYARRECTSRELDFTYAENCEIGHSMGQRPGHEEPVIHPFDKTTLEPNMVLAIEPMFIDKGEYYHVEDTVLVTETSPQILSKTSWDAGKLFVFE